MIMLVTLAFFRAHFAGKNASLDHRSQYLDVLTGSAHRNLGSCVANVCAI
jgi:hypothetical protein